MIPTAQAGISPSRLEVNLASFPVDGYPTTSTGGGVTNGGTPPIFPSCPTTDTLRACIQYFFNNNPAYGTVNPENFVGQGVTGVRFMFALWGGGSNNNATGGTSTPWDVNGNVQAAWLNSLYQLFSDLHKYGIQYVTPDPVMTGTWTAQAGTGPCPAAGSHLCTEAVTSCGSKKTLGFFPWLPFGLDPNNHNYVADQGTNQAYNCSAANPIFWGWSKFFNLMGVIAQQAQLAGLTVGEADIDNEINLEQFTVAARLLYDNTTMTSVVQGVGEAMAHYGFSSSRVTIDVGTFNVAAYMGGGYDCGSVYGDSAILDYSSQALAAFGGAKIGQEPYTTYGNTSLPCYNYSSVCGPPTLTQAWVSCATAGMISLPVSLPVPSIQDVHAQPCLISGTPGAWGSCAPADDTTTFAKDLYSDLWSFLSYRGLTGSLMMIGETTSNQPGSTACEGHLPANATQNVNGYLAGTLYASDGANVVMRPWENSRELLYPPDCYLMPAPIGGSYGPY